MTGYVRLASVVTQIDKAREELEKKKADFKAGKSLTVSPLTFAHLFNTFLIRLRYRFLIHL